MTNLPLKWNLPKLKTRLDLYVRGSMEAQRYVDAVSRQRRARETATMISKLTLKDAETIYREAIDVVVAEQTVAKS